MRIRLLREVNGAKAHSIVECDDATGVPLVESGDAERFGADEEANERATAIKAMAAKGAQVNIKRGEKMSKEYMVGKAIQSFVSGKAVTGMSEGTAADGGAVLYTAVAEIVGAGLMGSKVYARARKIPMPKGANAIKVPVDSSNPFLRASAPVVTSPAEGAQKTATKLAFDPVTLTLGKTVLYIPLTDELLQDAPALEAYVVQYGKGKIALDLDAAILTGGTGGHTAIVGASGYAVTSNLTLSSEAVAKAEIQGYVAKIQPGLSPEWYVSIGTWASIVGVLATASNIEKMLIDVRPGQERLWGLPVNVMPCLNAQCILADVGQYTVAEAALADVVTMTDGIRFDYDESVLRIVHRSAGAPTFHTKATADSLTVGAFVSKA